MKAGRRIKTIIDAIFASSALLAVAACGSVDTQSNAGKAAPAGGAAVGLLSPPGPSGDPGGEPGQEPGGTASLDKAIAAAMDAVKGSTVLSVQSENGGQIWEVQLAGSDGTERLVEVDESGKVVSGPRVKDTGKGEKARVMAIVKDAELTFKDAVDKVSSAVHGKITHMSLDRYNDNNLLVWDVDVATPDGTWQGVKVDAKTGAVTKNG
ncbi:PepSY domain-containing protein [Nonomuraea sp. NEAU-A123]|uniref:PepSY domain-containing protein n=1 Tax=Nonomuraea sp. NEAU-A123 TaxID=2839649 RepID=UPI001BE480B7|nr:PepSY domain-containing protein [Nonomuraea sp. NEAU-A123]MBT2233175.1 PepSY domain-containing protein [Nonomuraea sp. NEAU-A123]